MLRGVWGAALRRLDRAAYDTIFGGDECRRPRYVLRPVLDGDDPASFEFLVFGEPARHDAAVWEAWHAALRTGLGPTRIAAHLVGIEALAWDGMPISPGVDQPGFALWPLPWPLDAADAPCVVSFPGLLRLVRQRRPGVTDPGLITAPTLTDLVDAALRRLHLLLGPALDDVWERRVVWLEAAQALAVEPWHGARGSLRRYSGAQKRDVELRGVAGALRLPAGVGRLAPLLAAAQWVHLGKSTVLGLGRLVIEPLPTAAD